MFVSSSSYPGDNIFATDSVYTALPPYSPININTNMQYTSSVPASPDIVQVNGCRGEDLYGDWIGRKERPYSLNIDLCIEKRRGEKFQHGMGMKKAPFWGRRQLNN
jgi:hypothetical protein